MGNKLKVDRRGFLRSAGAAGAGLLLAFKLPAAAFAENSNAESFSPSAYLAITPDNKITIWATRSEMGQGIRTALPMMLADELEADWNQIELRQAWPGEKFKGIRLRTSGSGSIYGTWLPLRNAGAAAREMLIAAAAGRLNVTRETLKAENGSVLHVPSGKRLTYGELALDAAKIPVPEKPVLKEAGDFRYIGKPTKRLDGAAIVTGQAVYGLDIKVPGMRYAVIEHSPVLGGEVANYDDTQTKKVPGVLAVVPVTKGIQKGVAVVAENLWAAMKGRDALKVVWNDAKNKNFSSDGYAAQLQTALEGKSFTTRREGEPEPAFAAAATRLEADYEYPFQAHACLETMNCVADVRADDCEIWVSTQTPGTAYDEVPKMLGLKPEAVKVNIPLLGGGFGRRLFVDYVYETVEISKAIKAPVQVVWTRADDMKHGFFHSSTICRMRAGLDAGKKLTAFLHKTASSDLSMFGPPSLDAKQYSEGWVPWGAYDNPYLFPAYQSDYVHVDSPVPTGAWRAVGYPQNVFARESFIDEIAFAAGKDSLDFRLELLDAPTAELHNMKIRRADLRHVLEVAKEKSGWTSPLPQSAGKRWGRGVACNVYHGETLMAQVAEVSVDEKNKLRIHRIVCVADCGQVVNPLGLEGQIESGIVWGLSAALHGKVTFKNGEAEQSSFADFEVLRMREMPLIEVHSIPKTTRPTGIGEQPVPLVAPAVANAIFAATGRRLRKLPFSLT
jgi:isoquinoline 1-oxidoreductase beta subunit